MSTWMEKAERAQNSLAKLRDATKSAIPKIRHDTEAVVAGALAGAIRGSFEASGKEYALPAPGGIKVPPEVVAGSLLLGIALSGQTDVSDDLHAAASGILAYSAGREAENFMRSRGTKPPGAAQ